METIVLKPQGPYTRLYIDGVEMTRLYEVKVEKEKDGPLVLSFSGVVSNEVRVET